MMNDEIDFLPLRPVRVRSDGKREYDPADKRRLIQLCQDAGGSVSGMALKAGVNANQLRKWIRRARRVAQAGEGALSPFVPVQAAVRHGRNDPMAQGVARAAVLGARLPNGATLEVSCGAHDATLIAALVQALWIQR